MYDKVGGTLVLVYRLSPQHVSLTSPWPALLTFEVYLPYLDWLLTVAGVRHVTLTLQIDRRPASFCVYLQQLCRLSSGQTRRRRPPTAHFLLLSVLVVSYRSNVRSCDPQACPPVLVRYEGTATADKLPHCLLVCLPLRCLQPKSEELRYSVLTDSTLPPL